MATLTVWKFPTADGAQRALATLGELQKNHLITVQDGAVVTWESGKKKPRTRQLKSTTAAGAVGGAFWGFLFGLIFLVPLLGMAVGAAAGGLAGSLTDIGIDDRFIKETREKVTEGTSALFLLTADVVTDRVQEAFHGTEMELIASNLSAEQEAELRATFADAD